MHKEDLHGQAREVSLAFWLWCLKLGKVLRCVGVQGRSLKWFTDAQVSKGWHAKFTTNR